MKFGHAYDLPARREGVASVSVTPASFPLPLGEGQGEGACAPSRFPSFQRSSRGLIFTHLSSPCSTPQEKPRQHHLVNFICAAADAGMSGDMVKPRQRQPVGLADATVNLDRLVE